jgi:FSR family fosmidomycin resistance protein-like MFS transporter
VSVFSTGGNIGIAIGPPLVTALLTTFGLPGSLGLLIPSLLVAALLTAALPRLSAPAPARATVSGAAAPRTMPRAMGLLIAVVAIRSWTQAGFTTFVPFYYLEVLGGDPRLVGSLLAVFLGAGVVGTLVAGPIADRVGLRRCMVASLLLVAPVALAACTVGSVTALFVVLALLGFVTVSTFTVSIVLGQAYLPRHPGMASGLIVGFATGAGGVGVTALGWVADHFGLMAALLVSALAPLVAFGVALFLPEPRTR